MLRPVLSSPYQGIRSFEVVQTLFHRGVVEIEDPLKLILIATGKIPNDRRVRLVTEGEHDLVAPAHLVRSHPSTQRILEMRVGPGLIQQ